MSASPERVATSRCRGPRPARPGGARVSRPGSSTASRRRTLSHPRPSGKRGSGPPAQVDPALWEALRQWRSSRAAEQKQPAFVVFTDATLAAIAQKRPATLAELSRIPGIGATKLERFGPDVLGVLR